jgi:hypothetical protein
MLNSTQYVAGPAELTTLDTSEPPYVLGDYSEAVHLQPTTADLWSERAGPVHIK